jgi:hypothetical protein
LLTITTPSGRACGIVTKYAGHAVNFRSSPTVFADTPNASVYLDRHLIRQATEYVERCNALGLYRINAAFAGYQLLTARIAYNLSPAAGDG